MKPQAFFYSSRPRKRVSSFAMLGAQTVTANIPRDRKHAAFHLRECVEELERIVHELETNPRYLTAHFQIHIEHAYHHLNYAWNSRRLGSKRVWAAHERDFRRLRQMPTDLDLGES